MRPAALWALGGLLACAGEPDPGPARPEAREDAHPGALLDGPLADGAARIDSGEGTLDPALDAAPDAAALDAAPDGAPAAAPDAAAPDTAAPDAAPDTAAPDGALDAAPDGALDAAPPDHCARQPDPEACAAAGCAFGPAGCALGAGHPACALLDRSICGERLDCAPVGDRCLRTLEAPCAALAGPRCSFRPDCRAGDAGCVPADGRSPCAELPFPACPWHPRCLWQADACADCPPLPQAQPWPTGRCLDDADGFCAGLAPEACPPPRCAPGADGRCLTAAQRCAAADDLSCVAQGCQMVRYRLCEEVTSDAGVGAECLWREVFVCEER